MITSSEGIIPKVANWAKTETNCFIFIAVNQLSNETDNKIVNLCGLKLKTLPDIFDLKEVKELDIGENYLQALPDSIRKLTNLVSVNLSFNQLSLFPDQFFGFTQLKELHLNDNYIKELPKQIGTLTSLQVLDLSHNGLTTLPTEIGNLTNLQRLHLNRNYLTALPKEMVNLVNLWDLNLESNNFTQFPRLISQVAQENLRKFNFSYNNCEMSDFVSDLMKGREILSKAIIYYGGSEVDREKPIRGPSRNLLSSIVPRGFPSMTLPLQNPPPIDPYIPGVIDLSSLHKSRVVDLFLNNKLLQANISVLTLSSKIMEETELFDGVLRFTKLKKLSLI